MPAEMRNEIRRFIKQHILSWIPEWNNRMQEYAGTLCYKGIATLIYACCEDIYDLMGNSKPEMNFYSGIQKLGLKKLIIAPI